jgi:predicted DCC family thiol-disulfide oxidoreductase YuxK
MQSDAARELLAPYHWPVDDMKSFLFIENGKLYDRSTAALRVCRYLRGGWPLCYGLIIVPKFIRDGIYNWVARNRYKWFGQKDQCMVPTPDVRARFLNG